MYKLDTVQAMLFLGNYGINQIEMFLSEHINILPLGGNYYVNQAGIFT